MIWVNLGAEHYWALEPNTDRKQNRIKSFGKQDEVVPRKRLLR